MSIASEAMKDVMFNYVKTWDHFHDVLEATADFSELESIVYGDKEYYLYQFEDNSVLRVCDRGYLRVLDIRV